jgi:hypothetical protein
MKKTQTPITDEYLKSVQDIKAETDPFFYTRLRARMERKNEEKGAWIFQLKPAYIITLLLVFLSVNTVVVVKQMQNKKAEVTSTALKNIANSYNLTVSNY